MARSKATAGHESGEDLDPRYCNARKRDGSGQRCKQPAGHGVPGVKTGRCSKHGGKTPTHLKASEREQARLACELFGLEMADRPPAAVLIEEITRTRRSVAWHETEIALALQAGDAEVADRRLDGWTRERRHLADVTAKALHAGVERRALELMEDEARRAVAVLEAFVGALGLDRREPRVLEAGRVALKVLPGGE